jgi:hypothetical protein
MIKKINLLISTLVIIFTNTQISYAQNTQWGPADIMEVTFRKLELCRGSNALFWQLKEDFIEMNEKVLTDEYCNDPIVIGSGDETFDIASVEESQSAGNYGSVDNLPPGETFTHVRLTVDRKFTIRNKLDENGKGIATTNADASTNNCSTKTLTDRNFGNDIDDPEAKDWTEEKLKYSTIPATPNGGVPSKMNVYYTKGQTENQDGNNFGKEGGAGDVQKVGYCQSEQCDAWGVGPWWYCYTEADCGSGLNKTAVGMSIPRKEGTAFQYDIPIDDIILIFKFRRPYTTSEKAAVMDIAFGTQKGVSANASGATGFCSMRMGWLNVFIRMQDARENVGRNFE